MAKNEYDELGQLISKQVGGEDVSSYIGLQKVDYRYNIRGWLKGINNIDNLVEQGNPTDLFAFKINYNEVQDETNYTGKALFNGNISETYWKTAADNVKRKYGYKYDDLNRLTDAIYQKPNTAVPVTNSYNESLTYDKNGNIMSLLRNGVFDDSNYVVQIDDLLYKYDLINSNQLVLVVDQSANPNGFKDLGSLSDDYDYDDNGNMIKDENKNIQLITYNHLNLPTEILFSGSTTRKINYLYNAVGQKLAKTVTDSTSVKITEYLDGFQYVKEGTANTKLAFFPHAEGYVNNTVTNVAGNNFNFNYVFNYTDHLGNVRLSYGLNNDDVLTVLEENHYYPFGLKHSNYNTTIKGYAPEDVNVVIMPVCPTCPKYFKYKFQGQERQDELGLNWDSFKYRNYDYAIGRFMSIDPLAEKYTYNSPYAFSENRVIDGRELEGLEWENFRTNQKKPGELKQKYPSDNAQRQHYSITVTNSKTSFDEFKSAFLENPQDFLTNSRATFNAPVNENGGPSYFEKGSFIKIDIDGPLNNGYVKVVGMENKEDKLTTTFGTMEGHMEKGKITFKLQQNEDGSITFSIDSKSEVDMGLAPESISRSEQKKSWNEVLNNISKYLDGDVTKKETKIVEPKKTE